MFAILFKVNVLSEERYLITILVFIFITFSMCSSGGVHGEFGSIMIRIQYFLFHFCGSKVTSPWCLLLYILSAVHSINAAR